MSILTEVKVPDIGDFKEVAVIELLVKPGDTVKVEQSLVTVESDKASMEIPSSVAGVVKELKVKVGDTVKEGSVVLLVEAEGAAARVVLIGREEGLHRDDARARWSVCDHERKGKSERKAIVRSIGIDDLTVPSL